MTDPRKPIFDAVRPVARPGLFNDPGNILALNNLLDAFGVDRETHSMHRLGSLSEHYESGGRGPGTVSSGINDPGGVSYGTYQLATAAGTVSAFVAAEGAHWADNFAGLKPGTPAFTKAWQGIAARDGTAFDEAQHAFIERTHYRPVVDAVKREVSLDLDSRADAIRDATWSCAVQHGKAAKILGDAVVAADRVRPRGDPQYDRALLEAIYTVRSDYVRRIAASADPGARDTLLNVVSKRYPDELARAREML